MKRENNIQKTKNGKFRICITKFFAVAASLVLVSITVSANGFWKQVLVNNTYGKMAIMMVDQATLSEAQPIYSENKLAASTNTTGTSVKFKEEVSKENELKVDNWMIHLNNAGSNCFEDVLCFDPRLKTDEGNFSSLPESADKKTALKVEPRIIGQKFWRR